MRPIGRSIRILMTAALLAATAPLGAQRGPAPGVTHLPAEVMAQACSPTLAFEDPLRSILITGGQESFIHRGFGPGDLITINAGTENGIEVGQEYFVRRVQPARAPVSRANPATIRTTGWVRIYAVDKRMSLVTVSHACDTIDVGDYLEPFALPQVPAGDVNPPKPQRENYGQIMMGTDRRTVFGKGDFFVVDRGSDHGVTVGARFIIYRDKRRREMATKYTASRQLEAVEVKEFLYELGEAVAIDVKPETSTLQAILTRDALLEGDYVALRK